MNKVEESHDDFLMAIEKDLQLEFEEESYGALESFIMDIDINQLIKEREDGKLSDILNAYVMIGCFNSWLVDRVDIFVLVNF